jgi:hypothetical protein
MKRKKVQWQDLSSTQRRGLSLMMLIQLGLLAFALVDLARRPSREVRGRKLAWLPVLFVNFLGPIAYLTLGRKRRSRLAALGR